MKKRGRQATTAAAMLPTREATIANLTYCIIILIAGLVGGVSYTSGATLEGAFIRTVVALLACMVLGYALNVIFWLASPERDGAAREGASVSRHQSVNVGTKLDVVAGDDQTPDDAAAEDLNTSFSMGKRE
jgi:hypothetical protein